MSSITFASYLVRLRTKAQACPAYLNYLLNSEPFLRVAQSEALKSVNQANLNATKYGNLPIPLPPLDEHKRIMAFLHQQDEKIIGLSTRVREGCELLREYRTALISAAVTGKIDVRGKVN